jgi:hypothetical protein
VTAHRGRASAVAPIVRLLAAAAPRCVASRLDRIDIDGQYQ